MVVIYEIRPTDLPLSMNKFNKVAIVRKCTVLKQNNTTIEYDQFDLIA
jgi:hypothetical protein